MRILAGRRTSLIGMARKLIDPPSRLGKSAIRTRARILSPTNRASIRESTTSRAVLANRPAPMKNSANNLRRRTASKAIPGTNRLRTGSESTAKLLSCSEYIPASTARQAFVINQVLRARRHERPSKRKQQQMPRRFFRRFAFKRHEVSDQWFMSPFRHLLHDHRLWSIRRKTVVPAFAVGIFVAFLPFPGHMLAAALAALVLRANIPVAALTTLVSNPLTVGPMYYSTYLLGSKLLALPPGPFEFEMSIDWVTHTFVSIWQPMLLGSVIAGLIATLLGYVSLDLLWRYSLADYKSRKRSGKM